MPSIPRRWRQWSWPHMPEAPPYPTRRAMSFTLMPAHPFSVTWPRCLANLGRTRTDLTTPAIDPAPGNTAPFKVNFSSPPPLTTS